MQRDTHANYTPQLAAVGCTSQVRLKSLPATLYYAIRNTLAVNSLTSSYLFGSGITDVITDTVFESEQSLRWCCG